MLAAPNEHFRQRKKRMSCHSALGSYFDSALVENYCTIVGGLDGKSKGVLGMARCFGKSGIDYQTRPVCC